MNTSTLFGLGILVAGMVAAWFLRRAFAQQHLSRTWRRAEVVALLIGAALGTAAVAYSRYPTADLRLLGFPFLAAEFQHSPSGGWVDFIGVRTYAATVGNFFVGLFLPQLVLAATAWLCMRRTHEAV